MLEINGERLIRDLRKLATFGKVGTGVDRIALSALDIEARRWLVERLTEAGLTAGIDRAGNVYGRDPTAERAILVGSHTDTVPMGGWLDGALGVIYALEIARAAREAGGEFDRGRRRHFVRGRGRHLPALLRRANLLQRCHRPRDCRRAFQDRGFADRRPDARVAGAGAVPHRPGAACCLRRGAYRTGAAARIGRPAHRRRDQPGRHPALSHCGAWPSRPRRYDTNDDAQGCGRRPVPIGSRESATSFRRLAVPTRYGISAILF